MTRLGDYLYQRSANKAEVARKTGISKQRISELSINESTQLRVDELFLIALALNTQPADLLQQVCSHLKLKNE